MTGHGARLPDELAVAASRVVCGSDVNLHVSGGRQCLLLVLVALCRWNLHEAQVSSFRMLDLQTTSTVAASQWSSLGVEAGFHTSKFKNGFGIDITRYDGNDMHFEMKGVSCAVRSTRCLYSQAW